METSAIVKYVLKKRAIVNGIFQAGLPTEAFPSPKKQTKNSKHSKTTSSTAHIEEISFSDGNRPIDMAEYLGGFDVYVLQMVMDRCRLIPSICVEITTHLTTSCQGVLQGIKKG